MGLLDFWEQGYSAAKLDPQLGGASDDL